MFLQTRHQANVTVDISIYFSVTLVFQINALMMTYYVPCLSSARSQHLCLFLKLFRLMFCHSNKYSLVPWFQLCMCQNSLLFSSLNVILGFENT